MNSETVGPILLSTTAMVFVFAGLFYARRGSRRNPLLRIALGISLAVLIVEVAFVGMFLLTLSGLPDMSEF